MLRTPLVVFLLVLCGCPSESGTDAGIDSGQNGPADAAYVNPLPESFTNAYGRAVVVHGGKVYVAGSGTRADAGALSNDFFIARFATDLSRDVTFGVDGVGVADFDGGSVAIFAANNDLAYGLAFDGDKPLLVGNVRSAVNETGDFGLARFTAGGQLDSTFGTGGLRFESYGSGRPSIARQVVVQTDGKFVAAGGVFNGGGRALDLALARYASNGTFDFSFSLADGGAGAVLDFGLGRAESATGLFVQPGGAVVVGGGDNFPLARLSSAGRLDPTFGPNGTGQATFGNGTSLKIVERTDGSLWQVGVVELQADGGAGFGKLYLKQVLVSANGMPAAGFGQNGERVDLIPEAGVVRGAATQADGKLLLYSVYLSKGQLLRLNIDGSLDTGFGTGGILALDVQIPLFEVAFGSGNHLTIDGNTAWVTDINVVKPTPNTTRQVLALVKVPL